MRRAEGCLSTFVEESGRRHTGSDGDRAAGEGLVTIIIIQDDRIVAVTRRHDVRVPVTVEGDGHEVGTQAR